MVTRDALCLPLRLERATTKGRASGPGARCVIGRLAWLRGTSVPLKGTDASDGDHPAAGRRPCRAGRHPAGDAAVLYRLRDERDRRTRLAGRSGRTQAGASPGAVLDVRLRL